MKSNSDNSDNVTHGDIVGGMIGAVVGGVAVAAVAFVAVVVAAVVLWSVFFSTPTITPEPDRFGLAPNWQEARDEAYAEHPQAFSVTNGREDNAKRNVRLWEAGYKLRGKHFPNTPQQVGDCVSWGMANAIRLRLEVTGQAVEPFSPYVYGISRVQIGNNQPRCGSDGAVPSFAAKGLMQFGFVTREQSGLSYSGRLAREWGCKGPPRSLIEIGKEQTGDAHPVRTAEELIEALCNFFPCTIGSNFGTREETIRVRDGRQVAEWNSSWAHQMCFVGYDGSGPTAYVYVLNSWGSEWPRGKPPQQNEPPGGVWVTLRTAERMIRDGDCWAISNVRGFDNDGIDWSAWKLN